jgi:hypothetical protein
MSTNKLNIAWFKKKDAFLQCDYDGKESCEMLPIIEAG